MNKHISKLPLKIFAKLDKQCIIYVGFIHLAYVSILAKYIPLSERTTSKGTKRKKKRLDGNFTRMLHAVLNSSRKQLPVKQQVYGHFFPISQNKTEKTYGELLENQGHFYIWRFLMDSIIWTGQGWPSSEKLHQLCANIRFSRERPARMIAMNGGTAWTTWYHWGMYRWHIYTSWSQGTSVGVMVSKQDYQTFTSEFDSQLMSH